MAPQATTRNALTLVELLVVVAILVILVAVVLPLAQPALRGREVREAARQVNSFLARAQADAIASGRDTGVQFLSEGNGSSFKLLQVRARGLFVGIEQGTRVTLDKSGGLNDLDFFQDSSPTANRDNKNAIGRLVLGKNTVGSCFIRFDYRGKWYRVEVRATPGGGIAGPSGNVGPVTVRLHPQEEVPSSEIILRDFQIRLPPRQSLNGGAPLLLPKGAAVNLNESGWADTATFPSDPAIMFGADGSLREIWFANDHLSAAGIGPAVFLKVDSLQPPSSRFKANALWVVARQQTGRIDTTDFVEGANTSDERVKALSGISVTGR